MLVRAARAPDGHLLSLAGPGKVSSWAGWGVVSAAAALPPVAALFGAGQLVLTLTSPCAV